MLFCGENRRGIRLNRLSERVFECFALSFRAFEFLLPDNPAPALHQLNQRCRYIAFFYQGFQRNAAGFKLLQNLLFQRIQRIG